MEGASWSTTVTSAVQKAAAPCESVAVRVTLVVPFLYWPEGVWVSVITSPSGSEEPLFTDADAAVQAPGSVVTVTFLQMACGGLLVLSASKIAKGESEVTLPQMVLVAVSSGSGTSIQFGATK